MGSWKMKILICDDDPQSLRLLSLHVQEYMSSHFYPARIVATEDPASVLAGTETFDIAFLDIQMDQLDGIRLGMELKKRNPLIILFFVTNYNEYIDSAMDLSAFRYFKKPFDVTRLYSGLDKAMEYLDRSCVYVFAKSESEDHRIYVDDILYVTREGRQVSIYTNTGSFSTKDSFEAFCDKLSPSFFYLVHKSFFVNLHHISKYAYTELTMTNGTRISVAPRKQSAFHQFWFEYLRRH